MLPRLLATAFAMSFAVALSAAKTDSTKVVQVPAITVTTVKAIERQTPVVFSEITRVELQKQYTVTDMAKLLADMPSTIFYSENGNSIGYTNLTMRGFDQRRIAVLINGIPQNDPEDHNVYWINFPDLASNLETIQVQRGAGLINYGAAAIGGSINMTTTNFANKRMIKLTGGLGWQQGLPDSTPAVSKYSLEFSSGLVDKYAVYGRISRINSSGYRDLSWAQLSSWFFSVARFDSTFTTQINVFGGPIADGLAYTGLPKEWALDASLRQRNLSDWAYDSTGRDLAYTVARRPQEIENFSQPHVELLNDWYINDALTFKSSAFYYTGAGFFDYDASWAGPAAFGLDTALAPGFGNALVRAYVDNRQGGWIPRMVWANAAGELTVGAEVRFHRSVHTGTLRYADGLPAGYDPDQQFYSYEGERDIQSAFGRQLWQLSDNVSLNTELQVVHHRYGITNERQLGVSPSYETVGGTVAGNGGDVFNVHYVFANPRVGVNWNIDEQQHALFTAAYTSREPRMVNLYYADGYWFSGQGPLFAIDTAGGGRRYDFSSPLVRPEHMLDIEAQYTYATSRLHLTGTVYVMSFTDELVKNGRRDVFGVPIEGNASQTRHMGLELQARWIAMQNSAGTLTLWGNTTISRNTIVDYDYQTTSGVLSLAGNSIAGFPDVLANVGFTYAVEGLSVGLTTKYVGTMYTDNFGADIGRAEVGYADNKIDPMVILNGTLSYELRQLGPLPALRLKMQVNNLTDRLAIAGGNGKEFYPLARRNFFVACEVEL
ncbi:MAG: TonB-dependent receptor plug domain-containing protein [Bacteroidetes bacterium]|nr:TonB-dependent receptor plug domain-containing protein [Bacteroidota bacterium]